MINVATQLATALRGLLNAPGACECGIQGCGAPCGEDAREAAMQKARNILAFFDQAQQHKAMTAGGHADEPWHVKDGQHGMKALMSGSENIGNLVTMMGNPEEWEEANPRRIVACVNACAGIPTEDLEGAGLVKLDDEPLYELVRHD